MATASTRSLVRDVCMSFSAFAKLEIWHTSLAIAAVETFSIHMACYSLLC